MYSFLIVLGHLLLGGAFVAFAVRNYLNNIPRLTGLLENGKYKVPTEPRTVVLIGIGLQFVGGLLVAIGVLPQLGALLMIVFLVLATVLFHPAWLYPAEERAPHTAAVLTNIALVGAFLLVLA